LSFTIDEVHRKSLGMGCTEDVTSVPRPQVAPTCREPSAALPEPLLNYSPATFLQQHICPLQKHRCHEDKERLTEGVRLKETKESGD
jgi:hypothetical protein